MQEETPKSILVLGSGVFALSTLAALLQRPAYQSTEFVVVSPAWQHDHTASVDSTRIIRADYSDPGSSKLAAAAQELWREAPWKQQYAEPGLLLSYEEASSVSGEGANYVKKALNNVQQDASGDLQVFADRQALTEAMNVAEGVRNTGDAGYINRRSGWANAGGALDALRQRLEEEHGSKIKWIDGEATRLLVGDGQTSSGKRRVAGAELKSGETLKADQTLIMTGAWTPQLLDLRGIATCTGQTMAYVTLDDREAQQLASVPVCFNLTRGMFFFPPTKRITPSSQGHMWEVKVAKHAYGFVNPQQTPFGLQSLPSAQTTPIPASQLDEMIGFLGESIPLLDLGQTISNKQRDLHTRLCHYLDTKTGDWLISPHPDFDANSMWMATGGSGHGYKFLPVLGERIADLLEGKQDGESEFWRKKWTWPERQQEDVVWCEDGSRAGKRGLVLAEQHSAEKKA